MTGVILSLCGYDSHPVMCGILALAGTVLIHIGYRIHGQPFEYEDVLDMKK